MNFRNSICIIYHFLLVVPSLAQFPSGMGGGSTKIYDGKISGTVTEPDTKKPVEFATVALYEKGSEQPIDGTVTDDKGNFKLKNLRNGKYKVRVSFIGFTSNDVDSILISDKKASAELGTIFLRHAVNTLKEATVEGETPLIETKIDKLIYNASKDITSKGGNATDVLRKVPMVQVDLEGNVMLQGTQNVKILINNKPSSLTAGSVADAMKMIPADEIEKVEVITSPSAKYDAEGTGGIINIVTKRKNIQGFSGMVNAGAGTRSSNLFGNLSFRQGRLGTSLNFGGFGYSGKGDLTSVRNTPYSILEQTGDNRNTGIGPYGQLTLDYDLSSKNNLSGSLRVNNFINKVRGNTENNFSFDKVQFFKLYSSHYSTKTDGLNYDASVDYKRSFKKPDQEFVLSTQLTNSNRNIHYDTELDSISGNKYRESSLNESHNREITFQADYTHPFTKKLSLEVGAKTILRQVKSDYEYNIYNFPADGFIQDPLRGNHFNYDQDIYAGYAVVSATAGKFGIKPGLRYEHTRVNGDFNKSAPTVVNSYNNYIPSLTLSFTKQAKYTLKLSYTQRIQRPGLTYLNPYVNQSDPKNISYGNPALTAEKSHAFELGLNWFRKFGSITASVYHRFTKNAIESIRSVDTNDVYITTFENIGRNYSTGGSLGLNVMWKMKIFLGSNFNLFYYQVQSVGLSTNFSNDGVNYNVSGYGSYKFSKRWGVQVFGNFNGPRYSVQGKSTSFWYYNLSARREFKNEKGGVAIGLDNFASWYMHFRNDYSGDGFSFTNDNEVFFLGARISFDYRFGKMEFGNSKKKKGIKNDDVKDDDQNGGMMNGGGK